MPALVTGQLLGLDIGRTLEVTNCFPFPTRNEEEGAEEDDGQEYQVEMMKCLREVNVDNNTVGWYQSTYLGSFLNDSMIETQFNYQEYIKNCVVVIYDPVRTTAGNLCLKAFRLTDSFLALYREGKFTAEVLGATDVTSSSILEELPIRIHNSHLVNALLLEMSEAGQDSCDAERLEFSTNPFLEKHLEFLVECIDDLSGEQNRFQYYERSVQRQKTQQNAYLQKKKAENAARRQYGDEVAEEDLSQNQLFKPIASPSRLESLLITNQIHNYCNQINQFSGQSFGKLFLLSGVAKAQ